MHIKIDFNTIPIEYYLHNDDNIVIKKGEIIDVNKFIFSIIDDSNDDVFSKTKQKKLILKTIELFGSKEITIKEKCEKK